MLVRRTLLLAVRGASLVRNRAPALAPALGARYTGPASPYKRQKDSLHTHYFNMRIARERDAPSALAIKATMLAEGVPLSLTTYTRLLETCVKHNDLKSAIALVHEMRASKKAQPTVANYNLVVRALARRTVAQEDMSAAESLVQLMREDGLAPDGQTYSALLSGYAKLGDVARGTACYRDLIQAGLVPDVVVRTQIIDLYGRAGQVDAAEEMLLGMVEAGLAPTVQTYTVMIGHLCTAAKFDRASSLFREMARRGVSPDAVTYLVFLKGAVAGQQWSLASSLVADLHQWNVRAPASLKADLAALVATVEAKGKGQ